MVDKMGWPAGGQAQPRPTIASAMHHNNAAQQRNNGTPLDNDKANVVNYVACAGTRGEGRATFLSRVFHPLGPFFSKLSSCALLERSGAEDTAHAALTLSLPPSACVCRSVYRAILFPRLVAQVKILNSFIHLFTCFIFCFGFCFFILSFALLSILIFSPLPTPREGERCDGCFCLDGHFF